MSPRYVLAWPIWLGPTTNRFQKSGVNPRLVRFLEDTEKFIQSHQSIIGRAPLQVYGSALVFTPMMSEVKKAYWKERWHFIKTAANIEDRWDEYQDTLEYADCVTAVYFSPDRKMLVSVSNDGTARLWDTATGTHRQILEEHKRKINTVVFSPDSKMLALASGDGTVRLWHATTGTHQDTLEGYCSWIRTISFSPDEILASVSDSETIQFWGATTGIHQHILEKYEYNNRIDIMSSPNSKILTSVSSNGTIQLLDATRDTHRQILEEYKRKVNTVVFSPDSKILASASNSTIWLWDATTGKYRHTLKSYRSWIRAISF